MNIATSFSLKPVTAEAVQEATQILSARLGGQPDLVVLYTTQHHANPELSDGLSAAFSDAALIGGTSCGGVMTEEGFHASEDGAIGLLGICDAEGAYGVGAAPLGDDPFAAAASAIEKALADAGRDYETPVLVWCCQPPGCEEKIIDGVQSVIGHRPRSSAAVPPMKPSPGTGVSSHRARY